MTSIESLEILRTTPKAIITHVQALNTRLQHWEP